MHLEQLKTLNTNPEMIAKRLEHLKKLNADPERIAKKLEHLKKLNGSSAHQEQLKKLNADPERKKKIANAMVGNKNAKCKAVEVFDLQTGETTTYLSILDAAKQLDLAHGSIRYHLSGKANKNKPFKGRY